jgi:hypothetical protein
LDPAVVVELDEQQLDGRAGRADDVGRDGLPPTDDRLGERRVEQRDVVGVRDLIFRQLVVPREDEEAATGMAAE